MRVLEQDYTSGRVLLDNVAAGEHTRFLLRRFQEIECALGEVQAAYESHVAEHGCAESNPS
jgi:predicted transcriptional regulator of viral defense system